MSLAEPDREWIVAELGRDPAPVEAALFENLWSEHCAYRSSRQLLDAFESEGERVVVGPGDDAAVIALTDDVYVTLGIESHNHPSYVDPYDGAATGVGGIVRDTLSMGAYPIALADCLYFGPFEREHSKYLLEGVVEGIGDYGNAIGVPTVAGSVAFHPGYVGNPLVNVACVGLVGADRLVTATATRPGNRLVLVGNRTGRDGLGGASFASEELAADAETADRPAVQVGDPYAEKLLIEANEALLDEDLVRAARDLGAAGLGGATSEMVAKGGLGARIELDRVHLREPGMVPLEILLAESQERMCYEVHPEDVERVRAVAERFHLGCSVVGEVTDTGRYVCTFEDEVVVDVPATFLADGAPPNDLEVAPDRPVEIDLPAVDPAAGFEAVVASPTTADKAWVYRQYDHEVGVRTAVGPGHDAAVVVVREADLSLALTAGAEPNWTAAAPYEGAVAVAVENAVNLATVGARPLAAVDCLNGGNPERPAVYAGFSDVVEGLAAGCSALDVPVVGGNVSLYNDSEAGPVPPTPTLAMIGRKDGPSTPPATFVEDGDDGFHLLLVGEPVDGEGTARPAGLGGSELLARVGGSDRFPAPPSDPAALVETIADVATADAVRAIHDVSHGGLAVTLAEMVTASIGASVHLPDGDPMTRLFCERPGRVVVATEDPDEVRRIVGGALPVSELGRTREGGRLAIETGGDTLAYDHEELEQLRSTLERALG